VNLTCGRNPWKRASFDDSTFRAYMKDPKFLRSILPVSAELDNILRRIFEFNPARRATIPELREMIMRCPRFTASKSAAPTPLPSPPFSPVDYSQEAAYNGCHSQAVPSVAPLPGPVCSPSAWELPFPQHSISSGSSHSDNDSVFSSCSSVSSASSTSSFTHVAPPPAQKLSVRAPQSYVSPANTWFHPFIQAANLVKHVSFQPPMMAVPVHVY
jgi:serine/threonine protein kinase